MAQIERRQARIKRIRQRLGVTNSATYSERNQHQDGNPALHHHIGLSENHFLHIGTFLRENVMDPAIKVF